jgi:hypothetical protein
MTKRIKGVTKYAPAVYSSYKDRKRINNNELIFPVVKVPACIICCPITSGK